MDHYVMQKSSCNFCRNFSLTYPKIGVYGNKCLYLSFEEHSTNIFDCPISRSNRNELSKDVVSLSCVKMLY